MPKNLRRSANNAVAALTHLRGAMARHQQVMVRILGGEGADQLSAKATAAEAALRGAFDSFDAGASVLQYERNRTRQLKRAKKRRLNAEDALKDIRGEHIRGFVRSSWYVRAGFSDPTAPLRSLESHMRQFGLEVDPAAKGSISATSIRHAKDAFAQLVLRFNREDCSDMLASYYCAHAKESRRPAVFVVHVHDEASMRVRSVLADADGMDTSELRVVNRTQYSKVQNQTASA